jgi:CheY-like chemotaxis protein
MTTQTMELRHKILVVDDEPCIRKFLRTLLEVEGFDVEAVGSGKEALTKINNGERPAFIILDVLMPDMNGFETIQELLRLDRRLNVIMTSCSNDPSTIAEALQLGARDYLALPFEKGELNEAMLRVKQRKQSKLLSYRWVERQISPLYMKEQIEFWAASNF